jgi:hypothetical protein
MTSLLLFHDKSIASFEILLDKGITELWDALLDFPFVIHVGVKRRSSEEGQMLPAFPFPIMLILLFFP